MIEFTKYHGTGNDFILVSEPVSPDQIVEICDRHFGIGADGLIYPSSSDVNDIKMNYFNSDGSVAKMCGNGMRCFVQYLEDENIITKSDFIVETLAGPISIHKDQDLIELGLGKADLNFVKEEFSLTTNGWFEQSLPEYGIEVPFSLVKVGTFHAVVKVEANMDIKTLGPVICHNDVFPDEVNVNFVEVISDDHIKVTTYERGAGWTLSCGTGVSASAFLMHELGYTNNQVKIDVPGGTLSVNIKEQIYLKGPAVKIAGGVFKTWNK